MANAHKSKLIPVGVLLIVLSFAARPLARVLPGPLTLPFALLLDGLRVGFFIGLALVIIGALRQRKGHPTPPQNPS
jgi:hypothetical protein